MVAWLLFGERRQKMRKPVFIAVTIFFLNVLIATSCFAKEKPKERKQFCEGVGPVYSINEDVTPPLLNVGSYRPVLKNNKAMLVLINDELQKAIGILVRTTKQKKTDDNNKKGQSNKTIETFFLDFRFYLIRLIEDESDKAMMSFGEKAYRVQISFGGKKWHDVKNFSGRFQIFSNDASFILTLWDSAIQDAADFFRGCLNKFPTYTYKSQWGDFDGDLGCGYIIVEDMICPPWYIRCNDCDPFYNSWLDWLEDQEDTAPSSGFDWDDFPNNGGSVSEWDDCGP
jgi:hypothetical protein